MRVNDMSRAVVPFEQSTTLVLVVEMGAKSWLAAGNVPGVERQPMKKLEPDAAALLGLIERWRGEAIKAGRTIGRVVLAYSDEVGRGFRAKAATHSNRSRPGIPMIPATCWALLSCQRSHQFI
jgi:hypothetical protein